NSGSRLENAEPRIVTVVGCHGPFVLNLSLSCALSRLRIRVFKLRAIALAHSRMEKCTMRIPHRLAAYQPTGYTEFDPMSFKLRGRMPYLLLVIATLILDRWTKAWIQNRFELNASATVIDGLFNITYVRNTGVAFETFSSISSTAKSLLLSICTALAAILVIT